MLYALIVSAAMAAPASMDSLTVDSDGMIVRADAVAPSQAYVGASVTGSGDDGGGDDGSSDGSGDGSSGDGSGDGSSGDGSGDGSSGDDASGDDGSTDDASDTGSSDDKGGCSAIGGAPAAVGALFGLAAALRRRRRS